MHHPTMLGSGLLLALATGGCEISPGPALEPLPNIVFILADDLGYGDLGAYGQARIQTPRLDRMAAEGMRFTQHYAGSTVCAPSRASLMTGLDMRHAPIRDNTEVQPMGQAPLAEGTLTLARLLQQAGYRTGLYGKWGLGAPDSTGEPNRQGFDEFMGYLCQRHAHNFFPEFLFRNRERFSLPGNVVPDQRPDGAGKASVKETYSPDVLLAGALDFIRQNRARPFFLYFASTLPHANNEAGDEGMEVPDLGPYAEFDWPPAQQGHAAMITWLDRSVGAILDHLEELSLSQRTVVIFTSDNGPHREGGADPEFFASSGPLRGIKRDLYEGGIRVPLIVQYPEHITPGSVSHHVSAFWDWMPTLAELVGSPVPPGDGISLLPELRGEPQLEHEFLYWEFKEKRAVRFGSWKAVIPAAGAAVELYDLDADLSETTNLAGEHPDQVARASALMGISPQRR